MVPAKAQGISCPQAGSASAGRCWAWLWLFSLRASGYLPFLVRLAISWNDTFLDWFETFLKCWWALNRSPEPTFIRVVRSRFQRKRTVVLWPHIFCGCTYMHMCAQNVEAGGEPQALPCGSHPAWFWDLLFAWGQLSRLAGWAADPRDHRSVLGFTVVCR